MGTNPYYVQYNVLYTTDTYKDRNGKSVGSVTIGNVALNVEADVDAFGIAPTVHMGESVEAPWYKLRCLL